MYAFNVILIGGDDELSPHVRRELANESAPMEAEFASMEEALAGLRAHRQQRRLLIVQLHTVEQIEELKHLASVLSGWPILVLPDAALNASNALYLNLMRSGAAQIVPLPFQPSDFRAALTSIVTQFFAAVEDRNTIAVAGATGGCGTTTLAVNLAYEFAQVYNKSSILIELSLRMGVIASSLNLEPKYTILDLLRDVRKLDPTLVRTALIPITDRFRVLVGPEELRPVTATPEAVLQVVETVRSMADIVVLDVPCTLDDFYFEALAAAGHVVLVGEQKIPSIRAMKLVLEACGDDVEPQCEHLVINRYNPKLAGFGVDAICKVLQVPQVMTIADDGPAVLAAVNRGCVLRLQEPRSHAVRDIDALASALVRNGEEAPAAGAGLGLMNRLRSVFSHS